MAALPFKFERRTINYIVGYQVRHPSDPSISYGFVWWHTSGSKWVAEYLPTPDGHGSRIPGFASRLLAAYFLYRYNKPEPSGREG